MILRDRGATVRHPQIDTAGLSPRLNRPEDPAYNKMCFAKTSVLLNLLARLRNRE
ncbi:MAG: hypothetical protein ACI915_002004 [Gammaproteobacteria bacterium]|jgi:hypothetical protein